MRTANDHIDRDLNAPESDLLPEDSRSFNVPRYKVQAAHYEVSVLPCRESAPIWLI